MLLATCMHSLYAMISSCTGEALARFTTTLFYVSTSWIEMSVCLGARVTYRGSSRVTRVASLMNRLAVKAGSGSKHVHAWCFETILIMNCYIFGFNEGIICVLCTHLEVIIYRHSLMRLAMATTQLALVKYTVYFAWSMLQKQNNT